jgi:hypothetical protein
VGFQHEHVHGEEAVRTHRPNAKAGASASVGAPNRTPGFLPLVNSTQQEQLAGTARSEGQVDRPSPQPPDTAYPMRISSLEAPVPHAPPGLLNAQG